MVVQSKIKEDKDVKTTLCGTWGSQIAYYCLNNFWIQAMQQQTLKRGLRFLWHGKWSIACLNSAALCNYATAWCITRPCHAYTSRKLFNKCDPSHQNRALISWMHFKILVHLCGKKKRRFKKKLRFVFEHKIAMLHPIYTWAVRPILFELVKWGFR